MGLEQSAHFLSSLSQGAAGVSWGWRSGGARSAAHCSPAVGFQDKHIEEVRKNKEGKDPGEAETD